MFIKKFTSLFIAFTLCFGLFSVFGLDPNPYNSISMVYAQNKPATPPSSTVPPEKPKQKLATNPKECGSYKDPNSTEVVYREPRNCLFLEEPIGGRVGYDLYMTTCTQTEKNQKPVSQCVTSLWRGGAIPKTVETKKDEKVVSVVTYHGPMQAVLTETPGKSYQGPFGLLYSYLELVYNYMSGLIVGLVVLFTVVGGIQMTVSNGDTAKFDEGKKRIVKALVGMVLWFTASLILYTINPTFFTF